MIEEELKKLTEKPWSEEEKAIVQKLVDGFMYYKKLIPRTLKTDMITALQMCNNLKDKLDHLIEKKTKRVCKKCGSSESDSESEKCLGD
jgi:hypothetical protein